MSEFGFDVETERLRLEAEKGRRSHIAALLTERLGYVRAGKHDRVAQVDEQLRHYGHHVAEPAPEPIEKRRRRRAAAGEGS